MQLGIIKGNCVSTVKDASYNQRPLLIVETTDCNFKPTGKEFIAIDLVGAGPGEQVLLMREGSSANQLLGTKRTPAEAVIVGIVDKISIDI